jgi:uncharacterized protein YegL
VKFNPKTFGGVSTLQVLPVVFLLDVSGSMGYDGKIENLNDAFADMVLSLAEKEKMEEVDVRISVITFGADVLMPVHNKKPGDIVPPPQFTTGGQTPTGRAFAMVKAMVEDREEIPSDWKTPVLVLVSDGKPEPYNPIEAWKAPLDALKNEGRSIKCDRFVMGIGNDADYNVLGMFDNGNGVFKASDAKHIHTFFKLVTMSLKELSKPSSPDAPVNIPRFDLDPDEAEKQYKAAMLY